MKRQKFVGTGNRNWIDKLLFKPNALASFLGKPAIGNTVMSVKEREDVPASDQLSRMEAAKAKRRRRGLRNLANRKGVKMKGE